MDTVAFGSFVVRGRKQFGVRTGRLRALQLRFLQRSSLGLGSDWAEVARVPLSVMIVEDGLENVRLPVPIEVHLSV